MKTTIHYLLLVVVLSLVLSCQKEKSEPLVPNSTISKDLLTVKQAQDWYTSQADTGYLKQYPIRWQQAKMIRTKSGNRIQLHLPRQPTIQGHKQGYRQLNIQIDPTTKQINAKILEVVPDAIYFQKKQKVESGDFSGRILEYDLNYRFLSGKIYSLGKQIGEIRPATQSEKKNYHRQQMAIPKNHRDHPSYPINAFDFQQHSMPNIIPKTSLRYAIETCQWYQTTYMDAEGVINVYTERICTTYYYDDGQGYNDQGNNHDPGQGQGGGGSTGINTTPPPAPSNLPGEDAPNVNPKKMVKCFASIPSNGAAFQVKVLVQEPLPSTSFNLGPNAFGHVAIQLTKQKGEQSITQVIGFYPTGTGPSKLISQSVIKDNSDLAYDMSASYFTTAENFQKILDYVANPPSGYHFTDYNCATFIYEAAQAGGLPVPDPTTQIGISGPGGSGTAMTPAGMASALRAQKATIPNANITQSEATAPASKGECNEE